MMRAIALVVLVLLGTSGAGSPLHAQQKDKCKDCRDHLVVCKRNYSAQTCQVDFDICMKACKKK